MGGSSLTPAKIVTQLQSWLTATANLASAKAAYLKAVADTRTQTTAVRALMKALTMWLKLQFGESNTDTLAEFGVTVSTRKSQSTTSKSLAVSKRAATVATKQAAVKAATAAVNPPLAYLVTEAGVQLAPSASSTPRRYRSGGSCREVGEG